MIRFALVLGLVGMALVASAGEPLRGGKEIPRMRSVTVCTPSWRLQVDRRLGALEGQVGGLESTVDKINY